MGPCFTGMEKVGLSSVIDCSVLMLLVPTGKPWLKDGLYKEYWLKYDNECSAHGQCVRSEKDGRGWWCRCESGFSGEFCEEVV